MNIQLKDTKITGINLSSTEEEPTGDSVKRLEYKAGFLETPKNLFMILFEIELLTEEGIRLAIDFEALFQTSEDITEEFQESHFPRVNAPAIAYPFLRSAIANILLQSGYKPVILPAINFTQTVEVNREGR